MKHPLVAVTIVLVSEVMLVACTVCDGYEQQARDLIASHAACEADDDCIAVLGPIVLNSCISAFDCSIAVRKGTDAEALKLEAQRIADDRPRLCGAVCSQASCEIGAKAARCDTGSKRCIVYTTGDEDAGS